MLFSALFSHGYVPCKDPRYYMLTILLFVILPQHIAINKIIYTVIYFDFPAHIFFNHLLNNAYACTQHCAS